MTNGSKNAAKGRYLLNIAASIVSVSAEVVSVPAGAAGTYKYCQLTSRPVLDSIGTDVGGFGDTSLVLTSTAFTTEVSPTEDANLANGEYWVDYALGRIRGRKADTSTSLTADYKTLQVLTVEQRQPLYENNPDSTASIGRKHLATATYSAPLVVRSTALEASHLIKASSGNLNAYRIEIAPGAASATYYIQFFNLATLPPESTAPDLLAPITVTHTTGTVSTKERDFGDQPIYFSTGCYVVVSSTQYTKTISGSVMSVNVQAS